MGYVEKNLLDNESIIYKAKISLAAFFRPIILLIIMFWLSSKVGDFMVFLTFVFSFFILIWVILALLTTEFALTNQRIIARRGIFGMHSLEILLKKVESISVSQPLDGMIFGFGTVTVVGTGGTRELFKSIRKPSELKTLINKKITELSK